MTNASQVAAAHRAARQAIQAYEPAIDTIRAYVPDSHAVYWRAFAAAGGLILSPKVWNDRATAMIGAHIEDTLRRGIDSDRSAAEFAYSGRVHDALASPGQSFGPAHVEQLQRLILKHTLCTYKAVSKVQNQHVRQGEQRLRTRFAALSQLTP